MLPSDYTFVPVSPTDYPMLREWLMAPHIDGWWGDPETEIAMIDEDIRSGLIDMRLVHLGGMPFAFVQDYPAHHWPAPHFAGLPDSTRAMDSFLGNPAYLGQGHAAGYLHQRATALLWGGAAAVVVDPDPANLRAVKTYARAGFVGDTILNSADGAPVRVMRFDPETPAPAPVSSSW